MRLLAMLSGKLSSRFCSCTLSASRFSNSAIRPVVPSRRNCQAFASCSQVRWRFSAFLMVSARRDSACMEAVRASRAAWAVLRAAVSVAVSAASSPKVAISALQSARVAAKSCNVWSSSVARNCAASAFKASDSARRRISPYFFSAACRAARHSRKLA